MQSLESKIPLIKEKLLAKYTKNGKMERYYHILGVAEMAIYLSRHFNVDETKAEIAALLHDYYKYESIEEMRALLVNEDDIKACEKTPVLYHACASARACEVEFGITDIEIINAIKYHVFGNLNMTPLEEIIMISDYTEKNRTYEACVYCRKLVLDYKINSAIYYSMKFTIDFLKTKGIEVDPIEIQIENKYKEKMLNGIN